MSYTIEGWLGMLTKQLLFFGVEELLIINISSMLKSLTDQGKIKLSLEDNDQC